MNDWSKVIQEKIRLHWRAVVVTLLAKAFYDHFHWLKNAPWSEKKQAFQGWLKFGLWQIFSRVPGVKKERDAMIREQARAFAGSFLRRFLGLERDRQAVYTLPKMGLSPEVVLQRIEHVVGDLGGAPLQCGRSELSVMALQKKVFYAVALASIARNTEPFHIRSMETEVIRMVSTLFSGDDAVRGSLFSDHLMGVLFVLKTYRDWAKKEKGIVAPELIVASSVHSVVKEAAHLLGISVQVASVNARTQKVRLSSVKALITPQTICLVGSVPTFACGVMDPIRGLGAIALEYGIGLHVDATTGFLAPFAQAAGYHLDEAFDFSVPGVSSVFMGIHHQYGLMKQVVQSSALASFAVLYRNSHWAKYQTVMDLEGSGGLHLAPVNAPVVNVALAYGTLLAVGLNGYRGSAAKILNMKSILVEKLKKVEAVRVLGAPKLGTVGVFVKGYTDGRRTELNMRKVTEVLQAAGWCLDPLPETADHPPGFCLNITNTEADNPKFKDEFMHILEQAIFFGYEKHFEPKNQGLSYCYDRITSQVSSCIRNEVAKRAVQGYVDLNSQIALDKDDVLMDADEYYEEVNDAEVCDAQEEKAVVSAEEDERFKYWRSSH